MISCFNFHFDPQNKANQNLQMEEAGVVEGNDAGGQLVEEIILVHNVKIQNKTGLFGSAIIHKQPNNSANQRRLLDRFDNLYTSNFNPDPTDYIVYRKDVLQEHFGA